MEFTGTYPGTGDGSQNGNVIFDPAQYLQRSALLEVNHNIYIAFYRIAMIGLTRHG